MGAFEEFNYEDRGKALIVRPSYFELVVACGAVATSIVDCTCAGLRLLWFPELTFDKTDPL